MRSLDLGGEPHLSSWIRRFPGLAHLPLTRGREALSPSHTLQEVEPSSVSMTSGACRGEGWGGGDAGDEEGHPGMPPP